MPGLETVYRKSQFTSSSQNAGDVARRGRGAFMVALEKFDNLAEVRGGREGGRSGNR